LKDKLLWLPEFGIGYYPVEEAPYDAGYWQKYQEMEKTDIGRKLNQARLDMVRQYEFDELLDIGIGSGAFIKDLPNGYGFDINPCAVDWLKSVGKYREPSKIDAMSFWDSLEHIHNPTALLDSIKTYAFISCPVYKDKEHILGSKHFRPDEHCWYWTKTGLMAFMSNFGFTLIEYSNVETFLGREDIGSFVFKRKL
jgi:hypothetical protein